MIRKWRFCRSFSASVLKQTSAAFLESGASTLSLALQHELDDLDLVNQFFKVCEFSLREFFPTLRGRGAPAKTEEQLADFVEAETDLTRSLERNQAVERGFVVSSLAADPVCGR
jgi:hypothetical protein